MRNNPKGYAALAIACIALALSIHATVREQRDVKATNSAACVDQEARDGMARLHRAYEERNALSAQLARAATAPGGTPIAADPSLRLPAPPDPGPRRYEHFEIPNPAVSVTQKDDGTYDIRTTEPSLAGSFLQVTAVTESGDEDKLLVRIP